MLNVPVNNTWYRKYINRYDVSFKPQYLYCLVRNIYSPSDRSQQATQKKDVSKWWISKFRSGHELTFLWHGSGTLCAIFRGFWCTKYDFLGVKFSLCVEHFYLTCNTYISIIRIPARFLCVTCDWLLWERPGWSLVVEFLSPLEALMAC